MTTQEAFDRVWGWFVLDRHGPGYTAEHCLVYYDPVTRNRCAIGCLLDDDTLDEIVRQDCNAAGVKYCAKLPQLKGLDSTFLLDLMRAHDLLCGGGCGSFHDAFEARLRRVAARYGLAVPTEPRPLVPV